MKLSVAAAVLLFTASEVSGFGIYSSQLAFRYRYIETQGKLRMSTSTSYSKGTKKQERRRIMASDSFHRMGFKDTREKAAETMKSEYQSELVADLKSNNFVMERDGVRVHLAKV
jgi:hypothetical protein